DGTVWVVCLVKKVTINRTTIDNGTPIKTGCKSNGWPNSCHMTALDSPLHMEAAPATFDGLLQNNPIAIGANKPETVIAVHVTMRLTNYGTVKASTSATIEMIKTESLL